MQFHSARREALRGTASPPELASQAVALPRQNPCTSNWAAPVIRALPLRVCVLNAAHLRGYACSRTKI